MLKEMVHTGQPPAPYACVLELMAVVEAGRESQKSGRPVSLEELRRMRSA